MPKTKKPTLKGKTASEKRLYSNLESLDSGDGLYAVIGSALPDGTVDVDFFYSNELEKLKLKTAGKIRRIRISHSSTKQDNDELLHFLFGKTRAQ